MIYVITQGSYSDYHICAVATTKERAEELRRMYCSDYYDQAEIEEYEENIPSYEWYNSEPNGYWAIYFKEKGELYGQPEYYFDKSNKTVLVSENRFSGEPYRIVVKNIHVDTPQEAFKIACDARAQYLAEKYGI